MRNLTKVELAQVSGAGNGGPQGGGPGNSGTGDKNSQFAGPGPGNSFKLPFEGGYKSPSGRRR